MAQHVRGSTVVLSGLECARLDGLLMRCLRDIQARDGALPPGLEETISPIHQAAIEFRASVLVNRSSGTALADSGSVKRSSQATERLSVPEAARLAGTSESLVRRLARKGVLQGTRSGGRGAWSLNGGSVAVWMANRSDAKAS